MENDHVIVVTVPSCGKINVAHELRKRGFIVLSCIDLCGTMVLATTMSKRLIVKLSLQEDIPLKPIKKYTSYQSLMLSSAGIAVILKSSTISASDAWIAHNNSHCDTLTIGTGSESELTKLCNYYGPNIALQFAFIAFNKYHLPGTSLVGLIVLLEQASSSAAVNSSLWMYVYCFYLALWSSYHLQRWKQRHCSLTYLWGVQSVHIEAVDAEIVKWDRNVDDVQLWRSVIRAVAGTAALVLAGLLLLSLYVPFGFYKSVILPERWRHIPIFMYCVAVPVLSKLVLSPLCRKFTTLERHATAMDAETSLVAKLCVVTLANWFCAPLYFALWVGDSAHSRLLLFGLIGSYAVATFLELRETQPALVANDASDSAESIHSSNLGAPSVSYSPRLPSTPARSLLGSPPATPLRSSATPPSTPAAAAAVVPNSAAGYSTPAGTPHPVSYPSMSAWTEGIAMAAAGGASKPAAPAAPRLPGTPLLVVKTPHRSSSQEDSAFSSPATWKSDSPSRMSPAPPAAGKEAKIGGMLNGGLLRLGTVVGAAQTVGMTAVGAAGAVGAGATSAVTGVVKRASSFAADTTAGALDTVRHLAGERQPPKTADRAPGTPAGATASAAEIESKERVALLTQLLRKEAQRPSFDLDAQYLNLTVLYGFLTLFAFSYPAAPFLVLVVHVLYLLLLQQHLRRCRRSFISKRSSLSAWQRCWEVLSFLAVLTNCAQLALQSRRADKDASPESSDDSLTILLLSNVLLVLKVALVFVLDEVPSYIRRELANHRVAQVQMNVRQRLLRHSETAHARTIGAPASPESDAEPLFAAINPMSAAAGLLGSVPSRMVTSIGGRLGLMRTRSPLPAGDATHHAACGIEAEVHSREQDAARDATMAKLLEEQTSRKFGFEPLSLTLLVALPPLLQHLGAPLWLYGPAALLYFSYLQATKNRDDRKMAMGIVSDPTLVKLVLQEMPSWATDPQFQRVEWFNSLLQKLWPQISAACDPLIKEKLQPTLDSMCPQYLGRILLHRFSLGAISPKIVGVRFFEGSESQVRMDVELRWAGDPSIVLNVGTTKIYTPIEVSELRLSAVARVELLDLQPTMPCFKAISVTFMKKPQVYFSLKVARLDIMNIGPADYNITAVVRALLEQALVEAILYPKKVVVPMESAENTDNYYALNPVGILYVTFERGSNLKQANVFGSDPYIVAKSMQQEARTAVKPYTLNPHWDETHDFLVYDRAEQTIEIEVFDADMAKMETFLGRASLEVGRMHPNEKKSITLKLRDVPTGSIALSCEFIPLGESHAHGDSEMADEGSDGGSEDVLFDALPDDLPNSVLEGDDGQDHLLDEDHDHSGVWAWSPASRAIAGVSTPIAAPHVHQGSSGAHATGALQVTGIRLRNLKVQAVTFSLFEGQAGCFVQCTVNNTVKRTKSVQGAAAPVFTETFYFVSKHPVADHLEVRLVREPCRVLGVAQVPLADVLSSTGCLLDQEYLLQSQDEGQSALQECFVSLRLHWVAGPSQPAHHTH